MKCNFWPKNCGFLLRKLCGFCRQLRQQRALQQALQQLVLEQHHLGLGSLPNKDTILSAPLASAPAATSPFAWNELPPISGPNPVAAERSFVGDLPIETRSSSVDTQQLLQQLVQWRTQAAATAGTSHHSSPNSPHSPACCFYGFCCICHACALPFYAKHNRAYHGSHIPELLHAVECLQAAIMVSDCLLGGL